MRVCYYLTFAAYPAYEELTCRDSGTVQPGYYRYFDCVLGQDSRGYIARKTIREVAGVQNAVISANEAFDILCSRAIFEARMVGRPRRSESVPVKYVVVLGQVLDDEPRKPSPSLPHSDYTPPSFLWMFLDLV